MKSTLYTTLPIFGILLSITGLLIGVSFWIAYRKARLLDGLFWILLYFICSGLGGFFFLYASYYFPHLSRDLSENPNSLVNFISIWILLAKSLPELLIVILAASNVAHLLSDRPDGNRLTRFFARLYRHRAKIGAILLVCAFLPPLNLALALASLPH